MSRFLTSNVHEGNFKPITLRCLSCKKEWSPFGKSGAAACSKCGQALFGNDPRRDMFESSLMIERVYRD